jgi:hypothetical protein
MCGSVCILTAIEDVKFVADFFSVLYVIPLPL